MNLTFGFIGFFVSIVIPGFLFQRFYYHGEFSKQFTTKQPVLNSIVHAIIPGVFIHSIGLLFLPLFFPELKLSSLLYFYKDYLNISDSISTELVSFVDSHFMQYIGYIVFLNFLSILLGYFSALVVIRFFLDVKHKILRYNNEWYYIFSGRIRMLKKFQNALVSIKNDQKFDKTTFKKPLLTYADVLIKQGSEIELFSGYIVDYSLNSSDINQLDKIYLLEAKRRIRTEINTTAKDQHDIVSNVREIPGDIFVLSAKDLVNINITYVPNLYHIQKVESDQAKKVRRRELAKAISRILISLTFIGLSYIFFVKASWLDLSIYHSYYASEWIGIFDRIMVFLFFNQLVGLVIPTKTEDGTFSYKKGMLGKIIILLIFAAIFVVSNWTKIF